MIFRANILWLGKRKGARGGEQIPATHPISLDFPLLSGSPWEGESLSVTTGDWANNPDSIIYQWQVDGEEVSGETDDHWVIGSITSGCVIQVRVSASNDLGSATVFSNSLAGVVIPLWESGGDTITGDLPAGSTLTIDDPTWTNAPAVTTREWFKNGEGTGVNTSTYSSTALADVVFVRFSATNAAGTAQHDSSPFVVGSVISGEAYPGNTLTYVLPGQWKINGVAQSGATGTQFDVPYTVTPGDTITCGDSLPIAVVGFDYYVDSISGSDSNSGTSLDAPFATCSPLTALVSLPNKTIGLKGGSTFASSRLALSGNNLRVTSYGSGTPVFECRDILSGFTKTTGRANVYEKSITLPGNSKVMGNAWADTLMLTQVSSIATCDSTPSSCYVASWTSSSTTLYLHPPLSSSTGNPDTDGKVYKYSARSNGIELSGTGTRVTNIRTIGNAHQDGGVVVYGNGALVEGIRCDDGPRHNSLIGPNSTIKKAYFHKGRNDLESTSANGLILYSATITGTSVNIEDTTFDQGDGAYFTGVAGHGVPATQIFTNLSYTRCTWTGCGAESGCNASNAQILSPVFNNCNAGFAVDTIGTVVTITGGSGSISRLFQCSVAGVVNSLNGNYTVPVLGTASSVGFYRTNSSTGNVTLNITNDKINVLDGPSANSIVVYWQRGSVTITGMEVLPALAAKINYVVSGGFSGGTINYAGSNNKWPFGTKWLINGTTYRTLAAVQAAGYEAGSTIQPFPATIASDDFTRPDENLEASSNWTRVDGVAAMAAVRSNKLATLGTTKTFYRRAALASPNHWVRFTTSTNNGSGSYVVLAAVDKDNWLGIAWDTTTWYITQKLLGTVTFPATTGTIAPASGQDVVLARRGNTLWLYVSGDLIARVDVSASLASNVGVGVVSSDTARNPWIDDFQCGIL